MPPFTADQKKRIRDNAARGNSPKRTAELERRRKDFQTSLSDDDERRRQELRRRIYDTFKKKGW